MAKGEYWVSIRDNSPFPLTEQQQNSVFQWKLDGKLFDETTNIGNDPLLPDQWHLFNTGLPLKLSEWTAAPNVDIRAPEAWQLGFSADIPIAIIDMGVDIEHPDLRENLWTNPGEIPGNNIDDDGNGYVDDIHGWNFADDDEGNTNGSSNVVYSSEFNHGTHVAGIAGARGDNGIGVSGVAWETQLMTLDVFNGKHNYEDKHLLPAIRYAVDNGAKVINMSLGGHQKISVDQYLNSPENAEYQATLKYAYDNDVFIAIAAGNEGTEYSDRSKWKDVGNFDEYVSSPAVYSNKFGNIMSVASSNAQNHKSSFSNFGQNISIIAPGGDSSSIMVEQGGVNQERIYKDSDQYEILSTVPTGTGIKDHPDYGYLDGTSMASPVIAGMAALIRAQNDAISAQDTVAILRAGADKNSRLRVDVNQGLQANLYESLRIAKNWNGPDTLTGIGQDIAPIFNLTSLTNAQNLTGNLKLTRDASLDSIIGFYRVLDKNGTVLDALGNAVKPGDANYQSEALSASNIVDQLSGLEINDGSSRLLDYNFNGSVNGVYLAPYAITGDNTWFAWSQANSDGQDHFKMLGSNQFGLDDQAGPDRDGDFTDVVMSFFSSEIF